MLGRLDEALQLHRDVYSGRLKLKGEEHEDTLLSANNYATAFGMLRRYQEARSVLRKTMPAAVRVLGENHHLTLKMRHHYAQALYKDPAATLDDLREAVATLEDAERIARRVLGGAHPMALKIERNLQNARVVLRTRETPPPQA